MGFLSGIGVIIRNLFNGEDKNNRIPAKYPDTTNLNPTDSLIIETGNSQPLFSELAEKLSTLRRTDKDIYFVSKSNSHINQPNPIQTQELIEDLNDFHEIQERERERILVEAAEEEEAQARHNQEAQEEESRQDELAQARREEERRSEERRQSELAQARREEERNSHHTV